MLELEKNKKSKISGVFVLQEQSTEYSQNIRLEIIQRVIVTSMITFIKAKLKKSDGLMNIDKNIEWLQRSKILIYYVIQILNSRMLKMDIFSVWT